jgi:uncharacterized protein YyaL (SSP411 family)
MSTNQLIGETSPYLQQHSHNPVNWYPWGSNAIEKAQRENKPILLSIGYTACHWCHVMAQESFEDVEIAKLMNQYFINIKVDREERPDLDKVYQAANHLLTQGTGGWPLTVFLDPKDLIPFYSGTYFPPTPRFNLPAFKDVLLTIADIYQKQQHDIIKQNEQLRKVLNYEMKSKEKVTLNKQPIYLAHKKLENTYDSIHGGFGQAPKFLHATGLEFLFQDSSSLVTHTLMQMGQGGIYDQLGGGFFRYSTDVEWRIPHFEKMLYDNAQFLYLYTEAFHRYSQPFFGKIARKTAAWILEVMQSEEGGFYASLDADSEHQEGKYYLWNTSEIDSLLTPEEAKVIRIYYGLNNPPNFEKQWHLYIAELLDVLAGQCKISINQAKQLITSGKKKLLVAREKRIPPQCDKKILASWNALMIKALFFAGDRLQEKTFIDSAMKALRFIQENLWVNKCLFATYKDKKARFPGYLDDYAFLLDALLTSLQTVWRTEHLLFAIEIADCLLQNFQDEATGGFYFTANNHEKLVYRPKTMMDEAIPSGNGIAARALFILGHLLGEVRYLQAAENTLKAAWPTLMPHSAEHGSLLMALEYWLDPSSFIIIRGEIEEMKPWAEFGKKQTNTLVFSIPNSESSLPGLLGNKKIVNKAHAFLCKGNECLGKTLNFQELKSIFMKNRLD